MSRPPDKPELAVPLNFLLGASQGQLDNFELARLAEVANLRSELHETLDKIIDQMAQAAVAGWFRQTDRETLTRVLNQSPEEHTAEILAWAKERIKNGQRSEEELVPRTALPPGAAHLAASLRYQARNIAEGKCEKCPQPLDRNSVRYCTKHLGMARNRMEKKGKAVPGSREYLYSEEKQPSTHGRQPGTLAALATANEQRSRAVLAELGIPPERAAVSLQAAKEALLANIPASKARAVGRLELFAVSMVPSRPTGDNALKELLAAGKIQRIGKGCKGDAFRYFRE
ncbi:MAG TPA: hypothetical protein VOA78_15385 [Candidatus Dormibacteraeota bacterium]|nr:hypothetical protein [Candidatus Dormibacteraeota bacterium]